MGKKKVLAWLAFGAAALAAAGWFLPEQPTERAEQPVMAGSSSRVAAESRFSALPAREPIGRPRGTLFEAREAPRPAAPVASAEPSPPPTAPPVPYRVAGRVVQDGGVQVLLARGDALITVREGDTLESEYRVDSIRPDKVTLVYLPLDVRQDLPVVSALPGPVAPAPAQQTAAAPPERAQLRWQGPERVRAGDRFEVTLKVTSPEALRAAPLQLTYDASVLEAVEVRAGRFFDGGSFSYRINPGGSIFVGASGKGIPAADAELFVVSFKPIKPAAAAELRLSALMLQGAAGRAIAHEQPAAFRTTIVQ